MTALTISIAQMPIVVAEPEQNLKVAREMATQAALRGSDFFLLPELWGNGVRFEPCDKPCHVTQ